ncbi:MAG: glycoside hydrolase family 20 zincin-like fold domain-containing protein [Candidatus Promineifilaceae bacterium]
MSGDTASDFVLLPRPRLIDFTGGTFSLPERGLVVIEGANEGELRLTAESLIAALAGANRTGWKISGGETDSLAAGASLSPASHPSEIRLRVIPNAVMPNEGYEISIADDGIESVASRPAGIFYSAQTLIQIIRQAGRALPCLHIRDWPDFPNRGVMLDISRDKVPTMETLFSLMDLLASWKINQFQLYTEHTFAYQNHPVVWSSASPITADEVQTLDRYCRERFIELVPNQNSFGHMRRWLVHKEYNHLAECPQGCDTSWGHFDEPFSLAPAEPGSIELIRGLYDELLPNFRSNQINVGCDETVDLGQGRSKDLVARLSPGRVYLDFLLKIYHEVHDRDHTMQFWGDIVMEHPDLVDELPRDLVALEWGYEANHPFDKHGALFADSKIPFYVCPGTSSWNSVAGRTSNAVSNISNAAESGLKHGAIGYLNTDWGDNGHWQPLPVSYLGYAYGAAVSWAVEANRDIDIQEALNSSAYLDPSGIAGVVACDLGNVYESTQVQLPNSTVLFRVLQAEPDKISSLVCPNGEIEQAVKQFRTTLAIIEGISSSLPESRMRRVDADLVQRELSWVADMLRHACRRAIWVLRRGAGLEDSTRGRRLATEGERLLDNHEVIWHARNRPGGFADSQARMKKMVQTYSDFG